MCLCTHPRSYFPESGITEPTLYTGGYLVAISTVTSGFWDAGLESWSWGPGVSMVTCWVALDAGAKPCQETYQLPAGNDLSGPATVCYDLICWRWWPWSGGFMRGQVSTGSAPHSFPCPPASGASQNNLFHEQLSSSLLTGNYWTIFYHCVFCLMDCQAKLPGRFFQSIKNGRLIPLSSQSAGGIVAQGMDSVGCSL